MDAKAVDDVVFNALAHQLGLDAAAVAQQSAADLEQLGLDSHGLMRVTVAIEEALGISDLDLPDEALDSPRALADAVSAIVADKA